MIPARCACGGDAHASEYVGGFRDTSAKVSCYRCGVSIDAGQHRAVEYAIGRWNELQRALTADDWKGNG